MSNHMHDPLFLSSLLSRHNLERFEFQKEYFPETFASFPRNHFAGNYFSGNFFSVPLRSSGPLLPGRTNNFCLLGPMSLLLKWYMEEHWIVMSLYNDKWSPKDVHLGKPQKKITVLFICPATKRVEELGN